MASPDHKIKQALDEARILVLVVHVLIGFEYRGVFESAFEQLPAAAQSLKLGALVLGGTGTYQAKAAAFARARVPVAASPWEAAALLAAALQSPPG